MYYLVFGLLYLFSLLPFWLLYIFSDGIYLLIYYVIRYRRDVVAGNLLIAFPEKTEAERKQIAKDFYKGFVDNFIETLKLFSLSAKELNKRFVCNFEVINDLYASGQSVQLNCGHFFNWEIANAGYSHNLKYPLLLVYMPIKNRIFEKAFVYMRKRFGSILIAATDFRRQFEPYAKTQYCLGLVADQNPGSPEKAFWTPFFNRMTPILTGPERTAKMGNTAVVMCNFYKLKRGYYRSELTLLTTTPRNLPHGEITRKMIEHIEASIRKNPSGYLWSHRRWKFTYDEKIHGKNVV